MSLPKERNKKFGMPQLQAEMIHYQFEVDEHFSIRNINYQMESHPAFQNLHEGCPIALCTFEVHCPHFKTYMDACMVYITNHTSNKVATDLQFFQEGLYLMTPNCLNGMDDEPAFSCSVFSLMLLFMIHEKQRKIKKLKNDTQPVLKMYKELELVNGTDWLM